MKVSINNICLENNQKKVIKNVSLEIDNRNVAIVGPIESGKTLIMKMISGIIPPTSGEILINGINMFDSKEDEIISVKKSISFTFQDGVFLSNLTILENLILPLNYHHPEITREEKIHIIEEYIERFQLPDLLSQRPAEVAPVRKKILAFIRAVVSKPKLLLMDDPLGNLDLQNQHRVLAEIKRLKEEGCNFLIATDSKEILFNLADDILIVKSGEVVCYDEKIKIMKSHDHAVQDIVTSCLGGYSR